MGSNKGDAGHDLHVLFFPFMAPGHMIPVVDMAKLFSAHPRVKATILTTPANASLVAPSLSGNNGKNAIDLLLLPFPSHPSLPAGVENLSSAPLDRRLDFIAATALLRDPLSDLLRRHRPRFHCLVSDILFPWTADLGLVPRLVFPGTGFFTLSLHHHLTLAPESPVVGGLPGGRAVEFAETQLPRMTSEYLAVMEGMKESIHRSYGVVADSFEGLEPMYAAHYTAATGTKAWNVGPVSLCSNVDVRGGTSGGTAEKCMRWLDGQRARSVLYVSFGSLWGAFPEAQTAEIFAALEGSGRPFLWAMKGAGVEWEERGKGAVVRGWAPQVAVLGHPAVGGFLTHCGWNSCLEGVCAGVPMVTWPLVMEQFYHEKVVVEVVRVGVAVGVEHWVVPQEGEEEVVVVGRGRIEEAVEKVMGGGEEAERLRKRAEEVAGMARAAVEKGGSSVNDLDRLVEELVCATGGTGGEGVPEEE